MLLLLTLTLISSNVFAQNSTGADSVISFLPGNGATFGQNFLPNNVLGNPDSTATPFLPSASENQILSLGEGGEIILGFFTNPIVDGSGVDFTVFENVFYVLGNENDPFKETAFVSVSKDGTNFYEFPFDAQTLQGLAGTEPTFGNENPQDPSVSGGNSFDLQTVGLDTAYFVKLVDTDNAVVDGSMNFAGGDFDLDAVVAVNFVGQTTEISSNDFEPKKVSFKLSEAFPNPTNAQVNFEIDNFKGDGKASVYNVLGELIFQEKFSRNGNSKFSWNAKNSFNAEVSSGVYFFKVENSEGFETRKFTFAK
ncbi:MAG: T9SS C-terminal target domain-containing protein [Calditrichaeota bacterium]|nr:MAG: T9SS C-terminal target domain-containing protein [Calditrichota bacterium]